MIVPVIPLPREVRGNGAPFRWPRIVTVSCDARAAGAARELQRFLRGEGIAVAAGAGSPNSTVIVRLLGKRDAKLGAEGYLLTTSATGVRVAANAAAGAFYAVETLEQLTRGRLTQAVRIRDWPAFGWRAVHLDVARHFFDLRTVKRYVDVAARYKVNVFVWHLTDDEAWRLPLSWDPALTSRGSAYTAAEIRGAVAYAARRYVRVVPEIEMPSHAATLLRAAPQLQCGFSDTVCPTRQTLAFLDRVLASAFDLFPDRVIAIGGDEVPRSYSQEAGFVASLDAFARSRGRRIAGWDDILTANTPRDAIIVAWTGASKALSAARHGNDTVVSGWPWYFDAAQGDPAQEPTGPPHVATLEEAYDAGVIPNGLTGPAQERILGGEAALWTTYVRSPEALFSMLLPRELAFAEAVWTPHAAKDWNSFLTRLPAQLSWLSAAGYAFRIPNVMMNVGPRARFSAVPGELQTVDAWTAAQTVSVHLADAAPEAVIHYTLDGSAPSLRSRTYGRALNVALHRGDVAVVRAAAYAGGRWSAITACRIHRVAGGFPRGATSRSWSALVSP